MKIGILQTGMVNENLTDEFGEYPDMFAKLLEGYSFQFQAYPVVQNQFPASEADCDGWLITGSKHGAYEDHEWIPPLEELIRNSYKKNIPLVGVCFGHQIMAQALGGKVEKFGGLWGLGQHTYEHEDGSTSTLLAVHQDQVVELPPEARVTASSDFCKYAGLAYKGPAISIQPHPEFSPQFVEELIAQRRGNGIPDDQADKALEGLHISNDTPKFAKQIAEFFLSAANERAA
ncbi:MAG: type 1 glutamine amidotransferase [Rhizobiaceae bacterium]|nr:type 1 glutamine amidotransferase [Rhizobiaceae bacterium]